MADLFFGGGLNETDPFNISPDECVSGENFLLNARRRSFRRRPAQDLVGTATNGKAIYGIMQMIARDNTTTTLIKAGEVVYSWDGTNFTSERSADITTSSRYRSTYWSLDDILVVTDLDLNDPLWKWDGTDFITSSGTTATAVTLAAAHGYSSGDLVVIAGADQAPYNGEFEITVTAADEFTYVMSSSTTSPATWETPATVGLAATVAAKYSQVKDNRVWLFNIDTDGTALPHAILASQFEEPEK